MGCAWQIPEVWETFPRTAPWFWEPLMVLSHKCHTACSTRTCGSVWQKPASPCFSPKQCSQCFTYINSLKGTFKICSHQNCVTWRVSNLWNFRRKDFQCKDCPVLQCEMKPPFISPALQTPIRAYRHFQNQTGTWAPASTLLPELQHILPKQKSKQAKNYATFFFIQLDDYIIRCFSISQQYLCVWVPEKDILSPSLPTAAPYSFLPLKDQSGANGSAFSPQGSLFWQSSAIPQAQLPKTMKIIISIKQLLAWELITRLFPFLTFYLKRSLI